MKVGGIGVGDGVNVAVGVKVGGIGVGDGVNVAVRVKVGGIGVGDGVNVGVSVAEVGEGEPTSPIETSARVEVGLDSFTTFSVSGEDPDGVAGGVNAAAGDCGVTVGSTILIPHTFSVKIPRRNSPRSKSLFMLMIPLTILLGYVWLHCVCIRCPVQRLTG